MTEELDLLRELQPAAEAALERHLRLAKEWMPHEYVPWGRGRDFTAEPRIARAKHFAHSATPQRRDNLVRAQFCSGSKRHIGPRL